ncbi:MAG TPA: hypothetical protein VES42_20930, partial [Pilimelia sp.]|nr:hypothetical protein [Pilimelia sp.]
MALAVALVLGGAGLAWADPVTEGAPAGPSAPAPATSPAADPPGTGWTVTPVAGGSRLVWRPKRPVSMGGAAVVFFAGRHPLGTPRPAPDGSTFTLDVPAGVVADPATLRVIAAGRRLDATTPVPLVDTPIPVPPPLPAAAVDPGTPGPYETVTGDYELPAIPLPGFAVPVERQAVVVAPRGLTGARPLVLFLHGRHQVCFGGAEPAQTWPCPAGTLPIPSHRGYLAAQRLLASQGYLTVSIAANGINGQDLQAADGGAQARSSLVRTHLGQWADWAGAGRPGAPAVVRDAPPADLTQVLLVGHSRGGEGVNRAALDSIAAPPAERDGYRGAVRWRIRGTFLLAPTSFGQNPVADVPSVVVLPGCDGDVADLQGQSYVDLTRGVSRGEALHSAVYVVGANHHYFHSEWTPGLAKAPAEDDWPAADDPVCGAGGAQSQ